MSTGPQGIQGIQGIKGDQGIQGPTGLQGIQGIAGPKGDQGIQGPTGIQGIAGPKGDQGIQGPTGPPAFTGLTALKSYSQAIIENSVTAGATGYTVLESYTLPSNVKGKTVLVNGYFHLSNQVVWPAATTISYGFAIDQSLQTIVAGLPNKYYHLASSANFLIGNYGGSNTSSRGGLERPIVFPMYISPSASNLQSVVTQSTVDMVQTQQGSVTTNTFLSTGTVQSFTIPSGVSAVIVHLWGSGGSYWRTTSGYGGGGAYVSGKLIVSPGQVVYIVVGNRNGTATLANGNGGLGGEGTNGGGFTGIFTSNITSMTPSQANAVMIACAGGGGAGGINSTNRGGGGGVTTGLTAVSGGSGGTQSAGGTGGVAGTLLTGGGSTGIGGGAGGGYYGGGSGSGFNGSGGGGGGSSYIGGLTEVVSANGETPSSTTTTALCGRSDIMTSFFGGSAQYGFTHTSGAAVIVTQGVYPTYIGSEVSVLY